MQNHGIVYIVDDDPAIRKSFSLSLAKKGYSVQSFASAQDFLDNYQGQLPACLLLDIRMPDVNGLELQEILKKNNYNLPIIFLTGYGNIAQTVQAMKQGAIDFLEKPCDRERLLRCIENAFLKSQDLQKQQIDQKNIQQNYQTLTPREKEVLKIMVSDSANLSSKQIAQKLEISHRTVELHRARIMRKMNANSIFDLVTIVKQCEIC